MLYQRSLLQSIGTLTAGVHQPEAQVAEPPRRIPAGSDAPIGGPENRATALEVRFQGRIGAKKMRIHGDYHLGQVR